MDQIGYNAGRTPFTDISNTIITGIKLITCVSKRIKYGH
jgi:hypothetical protein